LKKKEMHNNLKRKQFVLIGHQGRKLAVDVTYPSDVDQLELIIYAHGINGFKDWGGMNLIAKAFAEQGFAFLKFNFSHNGTTPENPEDFVDFEAYQNDNYSIRQNDLNLLFSQILQPDIFEFRVQSTNLIGHSRGGVDAILFTANDERVDKLITWASPSNAQTPWSKWDDKKLKQWEKEGVVKILNGRSKQEMPIGFQLKEEFLKADRRLNVKIAAEQIEKPWLIVHGTKDEAVLFEQAKQLSVWQPAAELFSIEGIGHTFDRTHPWKSEVLPNASKSLVNSTIRFLLGSNP